VEKPTCRQLTTCCGLWCGDCVPYQRELFEAARSFRGLLEKYHFDEYVKTKLGKVEEYSHYEEFARLLDYMIREECTVQCYDGPCSEVNCSPACPLKSCAAEKGLEGCWDCDYTACSHILDMEPRHPDILYSLEMIRTHGIDGWAPYRGAHHPWQKRCPGDGGGAVKTASLKEEPQ